MTKENYPDKKGTLSQNKRKVKKKYKCKHCKFETNDKFMMNLHLQTLHNRLEK